MSTSAAVRRTELRVRGTVQGVGFRPYVYRLAGELGLSGFVLNDSEGVRLEVEGPAPAVAEFILRLDAEAPPLARLESVAAEEREPVGHSGFAIRDSPRSGAPDAAVTPDSATCEPCRRELLDPADRRFRYPFINCTDCGPRFTIVRGVPYDRPLTTMAGFTMCPSCRAEYEDPLDRRFHAQHNACPECGPQVALLDGNGDRVSLAEGEDQVRAAAHALLEGAIVAVKGIGGYHLACRADEERPVATLRARKHREDKPFALMVASLSAARRLVEVGELEAKLLRSCARPIVLAARLEGGAVAASVAPGSPDLGVMLPYSPLHLLLLDDLRAAGGGEAPALVMTSGNVSDEPIAYRDTDALERLGGIADLLLVHDRPIHTRTDDSVVRLTAGPSVDDTGPVVRPRRGAPLERPAAALQVSVLRRSRGYVPDAIRLVGGTPVPLLACGAELKSTFCLARGERAWVSHHIGDLQNYETLRSFTEGVAHFERLFAVTPKLVAHDLHPEYLSTKHAVDRVDLELIGVQHHHAHLAACLAEHGVGGPALGLIFDGSGLGADGTLWGGELLLGDLTSFERIGRLRPVALPGGEQAVRQPWRMACAWLTAASQSASEPALDRAPVGPRGRLRDGPDRARWRAVASLAASGACPVTSSIGRLFDAVAALAGLRSEVSYEGQAAVELEAAARLVAEPGRYRVAGRYPVAVGKVEGLLEIDPREMIRQVAADAERDVPPQIIAGRFHAWLAGAAIGAAVRAASEHDVEVAVLSGGVFQNRILFEAVATGLGQAGLRVLSPERLPMNDGGISFGQAAVAAARMREVT
ncbi:MAG TPA: carbamoyltransferase HypF [Solirubrobacteraceae bacterium]|nr:carbamoyltransferase HypF [Solirubrobacteraceae bacterium]